MSDFAMVHFELDDLNHFKARKQMKHDVRIFEPHIHAYDSGDPYTCIYTAMHKDNVVAICGIHQLRKGLAEIFMATNDGASAVAMPFTKACQKMLEEHISVWELHRVEGYIHEDFDMAMKWAVVMGFEREAFLRKFGPEKENYYLYARVEQ